MKGFLERFLQKLTGPKTGMDWLWILVVALNTVSLVRALVSGNMEQVVVSGAFLALCLYSLF
jgi:hypothetical protein